MSGRNISYKPFDGGATVTVLDRDEAAHNVGYNDLTTDSKGRVYAGSLGASPVFEDGREPQAGDLYLIDLDGSARIVGTDVQLTHGLGFSPTEASSTTPIRRGRRVLLQRGRRRVSRRETPVPWNRARRAGRPGGFRRRRGLGSPGRRRRGGVYTAAGAERDFIEIQSPCAPVSALAAPASATCTSFAVPKAATATAPGPCTERRQARRLAGISGACEDRLMGRAAVGSHGGGASAGHRRACR